MLISPRKGASFKLPKLPALRAEVAAAAALATPALYPAFFFVLEKAVKSAGNAVISTLLMHRSYGLQHLRHKRPMFAFLGESGYTLGFAQRIAHNGLHVETGAVSVGGALTPSERSARSQTSPGRVTERRTLPLLGLGRGCSQRTQRASGQRCAYARRCSEASRPRWAAQTDTTR